MKKDFLWSLLAIVMAATLSVGLSSCSKDDDPDTITIAMPSVTLPQNGGTQIVPVTCNTNWTVSGQPSWLTVSPMQGSGNGQIVLTAQANTERNSRNCTLFVQAGSASSTIMVTQGVDNSSSDIEGNYVGSLKPMGYTDPAAPCYVNITKLATNTYRLTSLICETFRINITQGLNLIASPQSDGRVTLTTETSYTIEGNYFQGTLTLSFAIDGDNFFFTGTKSN